jgi:putative acetyltransferase
MNPMPDIIPATLPHHFEDAKSLFHAYAHWLGLDLSFQKFAEELSDISGMYAPPKGNCWLAFHHQNAIGCIALRPINEQIGELKRMYVIPEFQGQGIGQRMLDVATNYATEQGYQALRLDTLKTMEPAMNLYKKNEFLEIPAYYNNPHPDAVYFEKHLIRLHEK